MTMPEAVYCPLCRADNVTDRTSECHKISYVLNIKPSSLVFICNDCLYEFKIETPEGRREREQFEEDRRIFLLRHNWRPDLTDDEARTIVRTMVPPRLRSCASRNTWPNLLARSGSGQAVLKQLLITNWADAERYRLTSQGENR